MKVYYVNLKDDGTIENSLGLPTNRNHGSANGQKKNYALDIRMDGLLPGSSAVDFEAISGDGILYECDPRKAGAVLKFGQVTGKTPSNRAFIFLRGNLSQLEISGGTTFAEDPERMESLFVKDLPPEERNSRFRTGPESKVIRPKKDTWRMIILGDGETLALAHRLHASLPATMKIEFLWSNGRLTHEGNETIKENAGFHVSNAALDKLIESNGAGERQAALQVLLDEQSDVRFTAAHSACDFAERVVSLARNFQAANENADAITCYKLALKALYAVPGEAPRSGMKLRQEVGAALVRLKTAG